jgi:hypothetical protein
VSGWVGIREFVGDWDAEEEEEEEEEYTRRDAAGGRGGE